MYKIGKVNKVISFEDGVVKLLVSEKTNGVYHELFFKKVNVEYDSTFKNVIHLTILKQAIYQLIKSADKFLGLSINSYDLSIPNLPTMVKNYNSIEFDVVGGVCDIDNLKHISSLLKFTNNDEKTSIIYKKNTSYILDGVKYDSYPMNRNGKKLSISFDAYEVNNMIVDEIKKIFKDINVNVGEILTAAVLYNGKNVLFVNEKSSHIFANGGEIELDKGIDYICSMMKKKLPYVEFESIPNKTLIDSMFTLRNVLIDIPVINIYEKNYKSYVEINQNVLRKLFKYGMRCFLTEVEKVSNASDLKIIGNDQTEMLLKSNVKINNTSMHLVYEGDNEFNLLRNENMILIVDTLKFLDDKNETDNSNFLLDVRTSILEKVWKQNIFLKVGLLSTSWAAKLK